jgi:beta-N-acetylhexosaminidase
MVGMDGTGASGDIIRYIKEFRVGGVILFARNLEEPGQIKALLSGLKDAARKTGLPPLYLAVDQEGGRVARLPSPPYTRFPGNPSIATVEEADAFAETCAAELRQAGFNMNLAPVLDTPPAPGEGIMADRAFPGGPEETATLGAAVIRGLQSRGVLACAKHFPGIGSTVPDSHAELPVCGLSLEELAARDLVPFAAALGAKVAGVMMSHILYPALDPDLPASLSSKTVRGILRGRMGYQGLVLTDDLDMGAVTKHFDVETAVACFLATGADLALVCHPSDAVPRAFEAIRRGLEKDSFPREEARATAAKKARFKL